MAAIIGIRTHDWTISPFGLPKTWPAALQTSVGLLLGSPFASFILWGPEHGLLYNEKAQELLGIEHASALGRPAKSVWPEIWNSMAPLAQRSLAGEATILKDVPLRVQREGFEEETWFSVCFLPIRDETGAVPGLFGNCIETTDKARQDRAPDYQSRARYDTAVKAANMGSFDWDLASGTVNLDARARDIFGFLPDTRIGQDDVFARLMPQDQVRVRQLAIDQAAAGQRLAFDYEIELPSGERRYVSSAGDCFTTATGNKYVSGVLQDVTAVVTVARRQQAIFDSAVDFAIIATSRDGHVTDWNVGAERLLGWSAGNMLTETIGRIFTVEDQTIDRAVTEMRSSLEHGRASDERWHLRRDGSQFWASGEMMPLRDGHGTHIGFVKVLRDRTAEYEARKVLRELEADLQRAQVAGGVGVFTVVVADNILKATPAFYRIFGVPVSEELRPEDFERLILADDAHLVSTVITRARGEVASEVEYRIRRADDGEIRWLSRRSEIERDEAGTPLRVFGVVRDITDQRLTVDALARSEVLARENAQRVQLALAAGAIIGTWIWDLPSDCFTVDEAFARNFGLDPAIAQKGLSLKQVVETVHPDDKPGLAAAIDEAIARKGAYAHQYRVRRADGRYYWIEANGRVDCSPDGVPLSFPGVLIDVEARRAVEAERDRAILALRTLNETLEQRVAERTHELERSETRARLFYDMSPDYLMLLHVDADGHSTIEDINPAIERLMGRSRSYARSRPVDAIFPPDAAAKVEETAQQSLEVMAPITYTTTCSYRDGITSWIDATITFMSHFEGGGGLVLYTGHDVSEQRRLEEQLRQSQKMEAVGQLTGGLAHDFNNLLTGVTGSLELLQTRIAQGRIKDVDRYIGAAQGAAKRAAALTHRLLAFSRRQTLDPKPTDVNRLVRGMEELIQRTVGPAITVKSTAVAPLWTTLVDPGQLENALLNLCINARDAMPDGGRVSIETSNHVADGHGARDGELQPGAYVLLCVRDTGTGMAPEVIAKAFDPFFTTKPIGQGTGLGLSMIYGFARQSGGQVHINSEIGQGTIVCIYLPRHLGVADTAEPAPALADAPRAEDGETVLVVDDEPTVRMLVTEVLEDLGYRAIEAADGAAGLLMLQSDARIDLLVTDVGLPGGMNGRQLADAARVARPELKVLFITGYAESAILSHGDLDRGMHVLTKPFAMEALASRIKSLISD